MNLEIGAQLGVDQFLGHGLGNKSSISGEINEGHPQIKISHHLRDDLAQALLRWVISAVGRTGFWFAVFDVLGADRWPHKDEIIVKMRPQQNFGGD